MKNTTTIGAFEKFVGKEIKNFLPKDVEAENLTGLIVKITKLSDLVNKIPKDINHDGCMGASVEKIDYFGLLKDGNVLPSPEPYFLSTSNEAHSQDLEWEGTVLGDAWGEALDDIKYVVEYNRQLNDWPCGDYVNERCVILHLVRQDDEERIKKIRRRSEDLLRKSDPTMILRIASILKVKLD